LVGVAAFCVGLGPALEAWASGPEIIEREPRRQEVVVVKPKAEGEDDSAEKGPDLRALQRALEQERRLSRRLRERLQVLRKRLEAGLEESGSARGLGPGSQGAPPPEAARGRLVIREYIWVPPKGEGPDFVEGHYELKTRIFEEPGGPRQGPEGDDDR
jgi:hypothetical protein